MRLAFIFQALGDRKGEAAALARLGAAYVRMGRYDYGRAALERSLPAASPTAAACAITYAR